VTNTPEQPHPSGPEDSFPAFMAAALPSLLRFGYVLTGDPHRGEELVQSALVTTYRRWRHLRHEEPHAYVRRAIVNAHTSLWRRHRRETPLPDGFDLPAAAADGAARYDDVDQVLRALRALPPRQRAVIVLRYYDDLSEAEIARTLGCSPGTVKSQASRALRTLRRELELTDHALEGTTT
jgi:RNA polymerase sigma-70 factor (sigma-E family)